MSAGIVNFTASLIADWTHCVFVELVALHPDLAYWAFAVIAWPVCDPIIAPTGPANLPPMLAPATLFTTGTTTSCTKSAAFYAPDLIADATFLIAFVKKLPRFLVTSILLVVLTVWSSGWNIPDDSLKAYTITSLA